MRENFLIASGETETGFGKNFLLVLAAHLILVGVIWIAARFFFTTPAFEPIVWLDGGGEVGSVGLPEASVPAPAPEPPEPLPPLPTEPSVTPEPTSEIPLVSRPTPTPTPRPKLTPTPPPAKKRIATPTPKKSASRTPAPKSTTRIASAKLATPRPGTNAATPKVADSKSTPGVGDATNAGTKGGPGAPGGSDALLLGYFKKIETRFHQEWQQPLTVVRSGRDVEAYVRLRAAPDGTVESLMLVKPTGNLEVDQSIEEALQRVTKVERPPAALLKNGVLDEMVAFILEL